MKDKVLAAASLLSGDFGRLAEEAVRAAEAGADWIHIDVMDGHFVPNITIGPQAVSAVRKAVGVPLDVHLMIENPCKYIKRFADAGSSIISVHTEAAADIKKAVDIVKGAGCMCGLVINPDTPAEEVKAYLGDIDMVLVMSVYPGFSGQKFIPGALPKLRRLRSWIDESGMDVLLEVDGGINVDTAKDAVSAGARVLVSGNGVYGSTDMADAIRRMKGE